MNKLIQEQISVMENKIKRNMSKNPSKQEKFLLKAFHDYLKKEQPKNDIFEIIKLEQQKLTKDGLVCNKKLHAQNDLLRKSTTRLDTHKHIRNILELIGLVFVGCILGVGLGFAALILSPLTVALIFTVLFPLAFVSSSMFSGLYYLFTKDTLKKEEQNVKDIKQAIVNINEEKICLDKMQMLILDIKSCCNILDSLPSTEASQSTYNSVQAGNEQISMSHSHFFYQQSINSNGPDSAENHKDSSPLMTNKL